MIRAAALLALALLVAGRGCDEPSALLVDGESSTIPDYAFTITAGAGEAIDRGEALDILPQELNVEVGEAV